MKERCHSEEEMPEGEGRDRGGRIKVGALMDLQEDNHDHKRDQ